MEMTPEPVNSQKEKQKPSIAQVLVPVAVILGLVYIALSALKMREEKNHSHAESGAAIGEFPRKGDILQDFELRSLEGDLVKLSSVQGKVTLINVWATWCTPCIAEMPSIVKLWDKYGAEGLQVIGINVDEDPTEILRPFEKRFGMKFVSYIDRDGTFSDRFGVNSIPISIVIDSERRVLFAEPGDRDWFSDATQKKVQEWLKGTSE